MSKGAKKKKTQKAPHPELVADFHALFTQKKADGTLRFGEVDQHVARALILLELVRAGEAENLSDPLVYELGLLLNAAGITAQTPPQDVNPRLTTYFMSLKDRVNPELGEELMRIKEKASSLRASEVAASAEALRKLADEEATLAPMHDEEAPESSSKAGTLAQGLGWKVRI